MEGKVQKVSEGALAVGTKTKTLEGAIKGSRMVVAEGQQYDIGEKPTVILYSSIYSYSIVVLNCFLVTV